VIGERAGEKAGEKKEQENSWLGPSEISELLIRIGRVLHSI